MKILNRIITFVTTVFVIIACIVFAATAICKIGNIEPRIVLSGSMEPKIHTGSICFINKKVPYDKIKTGDIIAFKAGKNTMVTHRVISVTIALLTIIMLCISATIQNLLWHKRKEGAVYGSSYQKSNF